MFGVTVKVLMFRYFFMIRQRWLLTLCYFSFPLILCFLAVTNYDGVSMEDYSPNVQEHDEHSLLGFPRINDSSNGPASGNSTIPLKIVVCPGGTKEQQLVNQMVDVWQELDNAATFDIRYVDDVEQLEFALVNNKSNYTSGKGLVFNEIRSDRLEYTIRSEVLRHLFIRYDWWDFATTNAFPSPMLRGPRLTDRYFTTVIPVNQKSDVEGDEVYVGFLPLQVAVDKAYIKTYFPNVSLEWVLCSFPYPRYKEFPRALKGLLTNRFNLMFVQYVLMMGNVIMISVFAAYTINDKVSGIRELMSLNGAIRWLVNMSWLISFCFEAILLVAIEVALLKMQTQNGPTIEYMSTSVLILVLVIHNWCTLCWVLLLSNVVKRKTLCVLIISAYWIFSPALKWIPPDRFLTQGLLAPLPNAGLVLMFNSFQEFDGAETVLGLDQLRVSPIHYLPVGTLLLIMLVTMFLLLLLCIYTDVVMPGRYGRAKPWYLFEKKEPKQVPADNLNSPFEAKYFEDINSQDPIGLECVGVSKFFRTKTIPWWHFHEAVTNLNMKIPKNKITILLGPNGAGKTTLFSMLCGMYSPSDGKCYTAHYDIFQGSNITKFQKALGYCPQSNLLMDELTVRQHLIIIGLLKGLSRKEAEESLYHWVERFEIESFENSKVKELSGGTKRKLCLAMAMTGDPMYLLLDEPSAGLDVKARKLLWRVLLQEKTGCTIIVSTHDMDEAEVLGDRTALIVNGKLVAYGSSSFLKGQLKSRYKILCTLNKKDRTKLYQFTQKFDRSILVLYETRNTATLGFPPDKSKLVPDFLKSLESVFGNNISTSLSYVTLEDVFIKFQSSSEEDQLQNNSAHLVINEDDIDTRPCRWSQSVAMFMKKMEWVYNQSLTTLVILLLIIPVLSVQLALYLAISPNYRNADLVLTPRVYSGRSVILNSNNDHVSQALESHLKNISMKVYRTSGNIIDTLKESAKMDLFKYRSEEVFGFDSNTHNGVIIAYYSRNAFHSAPIAYSTLINALLFTTNQRNVPSITTHNFPYDPLQGEKGSSSCSSPIAFVDTIPLLIFMGPVYLMVGSYFIIFPKAERQTLFSHLQLTTGLMPLVYWLSNLMFDFVLYSISALIIMILLVFESTGLFLNITVVLALTTVLLLYGISTIALAYAVSFCRCSTSTVVILFISMQPLLLLLYGAWFLYSASGGREPPPTRYMNSSPWAILLKSLVKIFWWATHSKACSDCGDLQACVTARTSLIGGLKYDLVYFAIHSLAYFTFIIAMDHGFGRKLNPIVSQVFHSEVKSNKKIISPENAQENGRVKYFDMNSTESPPELTCDGLGKKYSQKTAVQDVTFTVERDTVFGLLGANGSGKTTTLLMLSGVVSPTTGSAGIRGQWGLGDCEYKYIKNIGFCPQFEGLLPGLSGRNTLRLFARLRGLKSSICDSHVNRWIQALDMVSLADRPCEQYSTGNQRKLSFAIAMIGRPTVVILDEPTAGIDPFVRRRVWDIFNVEHSGRAVVLTSHTISEIEATCDRITFMVNGKMECLGTVPEVKNKFGKFCTLHIKLRSDTSAKQMESILKKTLEESQFSRHAKLEEEETNALTISVNLEKIKVYEVFAEMTSIKNANSMIEDFSLTETSLEGVFLTIIEANKRKVPEKSQNKKRKPRRKTQR